MRKYPRVGSRWWVSLGPEIPRTLVVVISSGHGIVAVKQLNGKYCVAIDILQWHKLYNAVEEGSEVIDVPVDSQGTDTTPEGS